LKEVEEKAALALTAALDEHQTPECTGRAREQDPEAPEHRLVCTEDVVR